jgi:pimeloyl-ACP methyl ester carboxylesterase
LRHRVISEFKMNLSLQLTPSEAADAPHIVLVHGLGSAATAWKPLAPLLQSRYNVITVDLPGHGNTPLNKSQPMDPHSLAKLIVKEVADQFDVTDFDLVGNSWGGWIALEMAAEHPETVKSVIALAPAGFWLASFIQSFPGEKITRLLAKNTAALASTFLKHEWARKIGFENVSPLWRNYSADLCLDATLAMANAEGYVPGSNGMLKKRFDSTIDSSIPVTIIFGDSDNTLPETLCQERTMAPAHSQWKVFDNCGHAPMWDHPEAVAEEIFAASGIRR